MDYDDTLQLGGLHSTPHRVQENAQESDLEEVDISTLAGSVSNKRSLYNIMTIEGKLIHFLSIYIGQMYLPPYEECTIDFMKQVLSRKKKVLRNSETLPVKVPPIEEFSSKRLYPIVKQIPHFSCYLPDTEEKLRHINRVFLHTVS